MNLNGIKTLLEQSKDSLSRGMNITAFDELRCALAVLTDELERAFPDVEPKENDEPKHG
jgi:hypothetical protein